MPKIKLQSNEQDQFITATEHGLNWANQNRRDAVIYAVSALVLILAVVGGYMLYQHRSNSADVAFGEAMQTYQTPLANSGQPLPPGMKSFNTAAERATAANSQFVDVAHRYGMLHTGKLALYFAGLTYAEEGQNTSAEDTLKKVAGSWDGDIAALGKLGLAQLYQQTGRATQAADLYNELAKGKANTVPPSLAQLQLAEMYSSQGQTGKARQIYAKLKDSDKDSKGNPGPAASIATEKLNPSAAAAAPAIR